MGKNCTKLPLTINNASDKRFLKDNSCCLVIKLGTRDYPPFWGRSRTCFSIFMDESYIFRLNNHT